MKASIGETLTLDQIPLYSHWPRRLLGLEDFSVKPKTAEEVLREFGRDKWGELLALAEGDPSLRLADIERREVDFESEVAFYEQGYFRLATEAIAFQRHLDLYARVLGDYSECASALVELGAGYGSKLLNLADRPAFGRLPLISGEYTETGQKLVSLLAQRMGREARSGYCDFRKMETAHLEIPVGGLIFTSYAAHYVPHLSEKFPDFLAALKPKTVVHFEPCFEHLDSGSLHDLMCKRYFELNDYTVNLVSVLRSAEKRGVLRIIREEKKVMGGNPFLPISIIAWSPV